MAKDWEQSQWSSVGEWLNKLWHVHIIKYRIAIKQNEEALCVLIRNDGVVNRKSKNCVSIMLPFVGNKRIYTSLITNVKQL